MDTSNTQEMVMVLLPELRTELFTTIYQHNPNVARAQVWHTLSHGKSRSE